ncbi:hypothetical protein SAMN05216391_10880 [Lachnospiraceae bacterium KHCPX20]|nr:hypothetical protein SAMN05216391_10880 [Lachnospiraceae bacterium KHCPX20]
MVENDVVPISKLVAENAIDLDGYLAKYGVKDPSSGWCIDKLRENRQLRTIRGRKRFETEARQAETEYQTKRQHVIDEYNFLIEQGKIRPLSSIEKALITARGHEDLKATHAARRILAKRGYDWKTGEKL